MHSLPESSDSNSILEKIGFNDEPSRAAKPLRLLLTFLKEAGSAQIEQIPIWGPILKGYVATVEALSDEEAEKEINDRIERLLTTSEQTQEEIQELQALSNLLVSQQIKQMELFASLREEFGKMHMAIGSPQLSEAAADAALVVYKSCIAREYQSVDRRGIGDGNRPEHVALLPLDDIYVKPRLLAEKDIAQSREQAVYRALLEDDDLQDNCDQRTKLEQEHQKILGERWQRVVQAETNGQPLHEMLANNRHIVVLGRPGSGKTTMTRFIARSAALGRDMARERLNIDEQVTPLLIPLAAYAAIRQKEIDEARRAFPLPLEEYIERLMLERGEEPLRYAVQREPQQGKALVLLDGVDEVPEQAERVKIVREVERFVQENSNNRFMVTSRPVGYVALQGEFAHYRLLNFSEDEVNSFLQQWQRAFARFQHSGEPNYAHADSEAQAMIQDLERNPKVAELATNPLMLVIISLVRYEGLRLPEKRVQLYERVVRLLMDTWNRLRSMDVTAAGEQLRVNDLIRVWGIIAEWMHRKHPGGVLRRNDLQHKLTNVLDEAEEDDPEGTAQSYLDAVARRAGLIEQCGQDYYSFWHPTFEEYLAARELSNPMGKAQERLLPLRNDPRWREVILLACGHIGEYERETATELIEAIAYQNPNGLESIFHDNLLLAASCIADDVRVKRGLTEQIIRELAQIVQAQPHEPFVDAFAQTVSSLPRFVPSSDIIESLAPLARHSSWEVRMEACRLFSRAAKDNIHAKQLCELLFKDGDEDVRCHAALGLVRSGDYRAEVWGFWHTGY